jgi:hypothetical protein
MLRKGRVGRRVTRRLNDDIGELRGRGSWRYAGRICTITQELMPFMITGARR